MQRCCRASGNYVEQSGFEETKIIGCQHHILDTILRHSVNQLFGKSTAPSKLNYDFVDQITENYTNLNLNSKNQTDQE